MQHYVYDTRDNYSIALMTKASGFNKGELDRAYTEWLEQHGIDRNEIIVCALAYNDKAKAPAGWCKSELSQYLQFLDGLGVTRLYCADAAYFKVLTNERKAEPHLGYVLKCAIKGYEHMEVILGVNHRSLIYNPANEPKLEMSLKTLVDTVKGAYQGLGVDIIKSADYPWRESDIQDWLDRLLDCPELTLDTETFSLDHDKAGLGTVGLAWSQSEGIAFAVDYVPLAKPENGFHGDFIINQRKRKLVRDFLEAYQGRLVFHGSTFDMKILIAALWMDNLLDMDGLLKGLDILTRDFQDTKVIAYLALNSTANDGSGYQSLKLLAHEFAGNWAQDDIKDIRRIPLANLLEYNLVDCLSTKFVLDKYTPIMQRDQQEELYYSLMLPSQKVITQMELVGMPMDKKQVNRVRRKLTKLVREMDEIIDNSPIVKAYNHKLQYAAMVKANAKLKVKQHPLSKFSDICFNPASDPQLRGLLYDELGLPILGRTKTKQGKTGGDILKDLQNHTSDPEIIELLDAIVQRGEAEKILNTFIKAFLNAIEKGDDVVWLHGNFNLGGTVSGRLSSSDPNLQNLPAGSTYGKLVKSCFRAPKGWIFVGADFNSLEDYISALTTRDPNKMKVYLDGYDGHCLRAFSYFPERLPGIIATVDSINSIKTLFPEVRQDSKAPTFLLTYGGTWIGLMKSLGWEADKAKALEANYHTLYEESDKWVQAKLDEASQRGYVEVAFGLRVRTPLLHQVIRGHRTTPFEAEAEGRTAGNALGQSYGLLTNRSMNEFMGKVWASEYRTAILPCAMIHDANYFLLRDNDLVVEWTNNELIKSMQWQELPEIRHDIVKLGAELSLFHPDWAHELVIPNGSTRKQIRALSKDYIAELNKETADEHAPKEVP